MDKYEYKQKTGEMLELIEKGEKKKAAEVADAIDWRKVRNPMMLSNVSGVYESLKDYEKSYRILKIAYNQAKTSREILSRLCILAIRTGNVDQAVRYYNEFKTAAPKDPNQYILRYKILKARRAPIEEQIKALVEFKKSEYIEEWAYELAKKYQEAGRTADCLDECDDLILWFSDGKYVYKAMELKMQYKPLTPSQKEKYDHRFDARETVTEEIPVISETVRYQEEKQAEVQEDKIEDFDKVAEDFEKKPEDEALKKLNEKGIVRTMKLDEALRSLLNPEKTAEDTQKTEKPDEGAYQNAAVFDHDLEELVAALPSEEEPVTEYEEEPEKEPEKEPEEEPEKEPYLPTDIQRMIDEIEGVIPTETVLESILPETIISKETHRNVGELAEKLKINDTDAFSEHSDEEELLEEFEEKEFLDEDEEKVLLDEYEEEEFFDTEEEKELTDEYEEAQFLGWDEGEEEESLSEEEEKKEEDSMPEEEAPVEEEEYEEEYEGEEEESLSEEEEKKEEDSMPEEEISAEEEEQPSRDLGEKADFDYKDMAATLEEEFRPKPEDASIPDDREVPDEEDVLDLLSESKRLSRRETAKLHATGKTGPIPVDEVSNAVSMPNTGFVLHGRYDLDVQSGVGTRAGLTQEQKKLFSYFVPVRGMSDQLVNVLERDRKCTKKGGTSRTGNLLIIGGRGTGKTVLAVDVVKAIQKQRNIVKGKVAIVTGDTLNKKKVSDIFGKLYGGALIIEKASKMNEKTVHSLNKVMEGDTGELLVILEDQRKALGRLLSTSKDFRRKFTSRLEVPNFTNDELVTFGQTYSKENGYRIDDMGILALYSRIDSRQREDHAVTVAEVKDMIDKAIEHSMKVSARKLVKRVFRRNTDESDRILLTEKDFNA